MIYVIPTPQRYPTPARTHHPLPALQCLNVSRRVMPRRPSPPRRVRTLLASPTLPTPTRITNYAGSRHPSLPKPTSRLDLPTLRTPALQRTHLHTMYFFLVGGKSSRGDRKHRACPNARGKTGEKPDRNLLRSSCPPQRTSERSKRTAIRCRKNHTLARIVPEPQKRPQKDARKKCTENGRKRGVKIITSFDLTLCDPSVLN